jgi:hypothetical protein
MSSATEHVAAAVHRSALIEFIRSPINWLFIFIPLTVALVYAIIALMFYLMP